MRFLVCKAYMMYHFCILSSMPCFELLVQMTLDWRRANMTLMSHVPLISGYNNSYFITSKYIKAKKSQNKIKKPPAKHWSWGCTNMRAFFQMFTQGWFSKNYPLSSLICYCAHLELSALISILRSTERNLRKSFNFQENSFKKYGLDQRLCYASREGKSNPTCWNLKWLKGTVKLESSCQGDQWTIRNWKAQLEWSLGILHSLEDVNSETVLRSYLRWLNT